MRKEMLSSHHRNHRHWIMCAEIPNKCSCLLFFYIRLSKEYIFGNVMVFLVWSKSEPTEYNSIKTRWGKRDSVAAMFSIVKEIGYFFVGLKERIVLESGRRAEGMTNNIFLVDRPWPPLGGKMFLNAFFMIPYWQVLGIRFLPKDGLSVYPGLRYNWASNFSPCLKIIRYIYKSVQCLTSF